MESRKALDMKLNSQLFSKSPRAVDAGTGKIKLERDRVGRSLKFGVDLVVGCSDNVFKFEQTPANADEEDPTLDSLDDDDSVVGCSVGFTVLKVEEGDRLDSLDADGSVDCKEFKVKEISVKGCNVGFTVSKDDDDKYILNVRVWAVEEVARLILNVREWARRRFVAQIAIEENFFPEKNKKIGVSPHRDHLLKIQLTRTPPLLTSILNHHAHGTSPVLFCTRTSLSYTSLSYKATIATIET